MSPRGAPPSTTQEDVVRAAKKLDEPWFTAKEIAEHVEVGPARARMIMNDLVEKDVMRVKQVGSGKGYWLS